MNAENRIEKRKTAGIFPAVSLIFMRMETQLRLLHRSDFRREVVLALLDAFAALEADVAHDVQRGASRLGGLDRKSVV